MGNNKSISSDPVVPIRFGPVPGKLFVCMEQTSAAIASYGYKAPPCELRNGHYSLLYDAGEQSVYGNPERPEVPTIFVGIQIELIVDSALSSLGYPQADVHIQHWPKIITKKGWFKNHFSTMQFETGRCALVVPLAGDIIDGPTLRPMKWNNQSTGDRLETVSDAATRFFHDWVHEAGEIDFVYCKQRIHAAIAKIITKLAPTWNLPADFTSKLSQVARGDPLDPTGKAWIWSPAINSYTFVRSFLQTRGKSWPEEAGVLEGNDFADMLVEACIYKSTVEKLSEGIGFCGRPLAALRKLLSTLRSPLLPSL